MIRDGEEATVTTGGQVFACFAISSVEMCGKKADRAVTEAGPVEQSNDWLSRDGGWEQLSGRPAAGGDQQRPLPGRRELAAAGRAGLHPRAVHARHPAPGAQALEHLWPAPAGGDGPAVRPLPGGGGQHAPAGRALPGIARLPGRALSTAAPPGAARGDGRRDAAPAGLRGGLAPLRGAERARGAAARARAGW